jgi:hypothetical protein
MWNVWHRLNSNCTASQAWCTYVSISRSGLLNVSASYSRSYQPLAVFQELKSVCTLGALQALTHLIRAQSDLSHLPTEVRVRLHRQEPNDLVTNHRSKGPRPIGRCANFSAWRPPSFKLLLCKQVRQGTPPPSWRGKSNRPQNSRRQPNGTGRRGGGD